MFTCRVVFRIRAESSAEFTRVVEGHFFPRLHAQEGYVPDCAGDEAGRHAYSGSRLNL